MPKMNPIFVYGKAFLTNPISWVFLVQSLQAPGFWFGRRGLGGINPQCGTAWSVAARPKIRRRSAAPVMVAVDLSRVLADLAGPATAGHCLLQAI